MKKQTWSHNLRQEQELQCSLEPQMNPLGTDLLGTTWDLELSVLRIYITAEPNPKYFWRFSPTGENLIPIKDHVLSLVPCMPAKRELMVIRSRDFLCLPSNPDQVLQGWVWETPRSLSSERYPKAPRNRLTVLHVKVMLPCSHPSPVNHMSGRL